MVKVIVIVGNVRKVDLFPEHMTVRKAMEEFAPEYINSINAFNGRPRSAESMDRPLRELAENNIVCLSSLRNIILDMDDGPDAVCIPADGDPLPFPGVEATNSDSECPF